MSSQTVTVLRYSPIDVRCLNVPLGAQPSGQGRTYKNRPMEYRRNFQPGGTFFFTVVTYQRRSILAKDCAYQLLSDVFLQVKNHHPFHILAWVIMPDHLHMIWKLPEGDTNYSERWSRIKSQFTRRWLVMGGSEANVSIAKSYDRRRGVWQSKFFEHTLRDESDLEAHVEYIHYNPVKHGYVQTPFEWTRSSFGEYVRRGIYTRDWGGLPSQGDDDRFRISKAYE